MYLPLRPVGSFISRFQRYIIFSLVALATSYTLWFTGFYLYLLPETHAENSLPGHTLLNPIYSITHSDEYLAFCVAVKDQSHDLTEFFVHHYHHLGIRRFYIMDDGSSPPLSSFADYGIPSSAITFHYYDAASRVPAMQHSIYNDCISWFGTRHNWIAFVDADEFFETTGSETIQTILQELDHRDDVGALAVNWRTHSSSGQLTRQPSVRKAFTTCIWDEGSEDPTKNSDNQHVKSIVKPYFYDHPGSPHNFLLKHGAITVGEHGDPVEAHLRTPVTRDRVVLHHYGVKSKQEYREKIERSNAMGAAKGWGWWDHIEGLPNEKCPSMAVYDP